MTTTMTRRWLTSLLILTGLSFSIAGGSNRKCPKYCSCSHDTLTCDGKWYPLHYIPIAPPDTKTVKLIDISLGQLSRRSVSNLTYCEMSSLSLIRTSITNIAMDTFEDLLFLEVLNLDQRHIPLTDITYCVQSIMSKLKVLSFKAVSTDGNSINASLFENQTALTRLTVSLGNLENFNGSALSDLHNLSELDLSGNHLTQIVIDNVIPNVTHLNLDGNNLEVIPQICRENSTPLMPSLRNLDIDKNVIWNLDVSPVMCLNNLRKLTLSGNRITELQNNAFAGLSTLKSVHLNDVPLKKIHDGAFNSSSLYKLQLIKIPGRLDPAILFKNTPNLGILDMTNTRIDVEIIQLKQFLLSLTNIEKLVLQRTRIKELPYGVFSKLTKLRTLILSGNFISTWKSDIFKNVTSIKEISFDSCRISIIKEDSFPLEFRLSVKKINLANNPFTCTCDLLWFRTWMKEVIGNKSIKFSDYPNLYDCHAPNTKPLRLKDFNPTVKSCTVVVMYTIVLTTVFSFCVVAVVVGLVAYRYRWHMLYWISLIRRRRQRYQRENSLGELKYDAFVSYSNSDNDWIYDELLNYLEGDLGLRLCEHRRDFAVGKFIVDNVFDAMDTSGKTILVISNDYMQSDWCQFELQMALSSFYEHETDLVVILLEAIQARHVNSTLRALMTSTTYIEWSVDLEAKALFRERLKNALTNYLL